MKPKVYIDGKEGTTGLQIYERLGGRDDLELLLIDEDKRKDVDERRKFLNAADIVFLCLPDAAAREAVSLIENENTPRDRRFDRAPHRPGLGLRLCELSPAHRAAVPAVQAGGQPRLPRERVYLVRVPRWSAQDVVPADFAFTCASLTGYSGGGKKMIAEYEDAGRDPRHDSERIYGLNLKHKHLPEMAYVCGLTQAPVFVPIVGDF